MKILSLNNTKHWKTNILHHSVLWFLCSLAEFGIIWTYNIWNGDPSFEVALHSMLENSKWTIPILMILGLCAWHLCKKDFTKNIVKIIALIIVTHAFVYFDFDNLILRDLWDVREYPSTSIFFNFMNIPLVYPYFMNIPSVDPYQILMLAFISLSKYGCEIILGLSIRKVNVRKYLIIII